MDWKETKGKLGLENLPDEWRRGVDLRNADLSSADLSSATLSSANLRGADLSYATLSYANLRNADLSYANLSYADLSSADLSNVIMRSADLSNADLRGAILSSATLSNVNLRNADLRSADLRGAILSNVIMRSTDLSNADLSNADLRGTVLECKAKERRSALRQCLQRNGGLILYRTKTSQHVGATNYIAGKTYTAPVLSTCSVTVCHPGIYAANLSTINEMHPREEIVRVYVPYGEWHYVSPSKGFRCRRVRVLNDVERG